METEIRSDQSITDIDSHFRVFAGPGAGKTHWLVNHINHVVRESQKLSPVRKIACITYTNVAADEIIFRLGNLTEFVESSTIHSFLYLNVVKPYCHLLKGTDSDSIVNGRELDGHDDYPPNYGRIRSWLSQIKSKNRKDYVWYLSDNQRTLSNFLRDIRWRFENDELILNSTRPYYMAIPKDIRNNTQAYRRQFWKEGRLFHDDVLYMSWRILTENPELQPFISARYPYIFVDEFQDTSPIQTRILKLLVAHGTIIGVIGDVEQSIYGFLDAQPDDFRNFSVPVGQTHNYFIKGNRRSTSQIVQFLNYLRADETDQECLRNVHGGPVSLYVGNLQQIMQEIRGNYPNAYILARKNDELIPFRNLVESIDLDTWKKFETADTNWRRIQFIERLAMAAVLLHNNKYQQASREILQAYRRRYKDFYRFDNGADALTDTERRILAVSTLNLLADIHEEILNDVVLAVYERVADMITRQVPHLKISAYRSGAAKEFVSSNMWRSLTNTVALPEEYRYIRTIHKSKGLEFDTVVVVCDRTKLDLLTSKIVDEKDVEEKRVLYVAASRAMNNLVFAATEISSTHKEKLINLGINIIVHGTG